MKGNLSGDVGKQLNTFEKLSSMTLKVMKETRKCIMALNEICNPIRTTSIKEVNQHNHLHQNSEKKHDSGNELLNPGRLKEPGTKMNALKVSSELNTLMAVYKQLMSKQKDICKTLMHFKI